MVLKKRTFAHCSLILLGGIGISAYASDFYTIIGPDGRPMIVQQKTSQPKQTAVDSNRAPKSEAKASGSFFNKLFGAKEQSKSGTAPLDVMKNSTDAESKTQPSSPLIQQDSSQQTSRNSVDRTPAKKNTALDQASEATQTQPEPTMTQAPKAVRSEPHRGLESRSEIKVSKTSEKTTPVNNNQHNNKPETPQKERTGEVKPAPSAAVTNESTASPVLGTSSSSKKQTGITQIDGVEYVDNEYLEDREFNLEGKKRFYIMSDANVGGSRQFETIEREKGISKSVFSKFSKNSPVNSEPVVLAQTYYRIPKAEVEANLEQSCFTGKKLEKAKLLSLDKDEMGLWPVPPIKERFVYDVVKLDQGVENIHFASYASSQKSPTYYWPLVVFLDQQGCVIEGVSGFKNQNMNANSFQYSALEGVLKKPSHAKYMFMTPLAEAVDVQDVKLSNQGQIKLSVLR